MSGNNVDFSQRTADEDEVQRPSWWKTTPPSLRELRKAFPYWPWSDPDFVKRYTDVFGFGDHRDDGVLEKQQRDAALDADTTGRDEAKGASQEEISNLRQTRAKGQRFPRSDKVPPKGLAGQASGQTDNDMEYLQDQDGADRWNKSRKF